MRPECLATCPPDCKGFGSVEPEKKTFTNPDYMDQLTRRCIRVWQEYDLDLEPEKFNPAEWDVEVVLTKKPFVPGHYARTDIENSHAYWFNARPEHPAWVRVVVTDDPGSA